MVAKKVIHSSGDLDSGGGGFIRVRVTVDMACPLCRGRVVTLESGAKTWVSFKYKRKKYDSSIRAQAVYPSSKNAIHVSGFYKDFRKKATDMTGSTVVKLVMVDHTLARHPTRRFPEGDVNPSKSTAGNPRPSKTGPLQDVTNVRLGQQGEKLAKWLRIDYLLALGVKTLH
uniref:Uncharacterized protein n=1 Tax=Quercus lobata TaxID=97700 RepID=A0A7N2MMI4_QUELO